MSSDTRAGGAYVEIFIKDSMAPGVAKTEQSLAGMLKSLRSGGESEGRQVGMAIGFAIQNAMMAFSDGEMTGEKLTKGLLIAVAQFGGPIGQITAQIGMGISAVFDKIKKESEEVFTSATARAIKFNKDVMDSIDRLAKWSSPDQVKAGETFKKGKILESDLMQAILDFKAGGISEPSKEIKTKSQNAKTFLEVVQSKAGEAFTGWESGAVLLFRQRLEKEREAAMQEKMALRPPAWEPGKGIAAETDAERTARTVREEGLESQIQRYDILIKQAGTLTPEGPTGGLAIAMGEEIKKGLDFAKIEEIEFQKVKHNEYVKEQKDLKTYNDQREKEIKAHEDLVSKLLSEDEAQRTKELEDGIRARRETEESFQEDAKKAEEELVKKQQESLNARDALSHQWEERRNVQMEKGIELQKQLAETQGGVSSMGAFGGGDARQFIQASDIAEKQLDILEAIKENTIPLKKLGLL